MRILRMLTFGVLIFIAGSAFAQQIQTDYDHTTDFSKYRTFMWVKEPNPDNPLMRQRIINAVNAQLETKGLRLVTSHADLAIAANTATKEQHTLESFYDDFPGWGWHRYWGPVTTTIETYEVGTLIVDVFDARTKQVKWWASATDTVSEKPEKNTKKLNKAVEKMFKDFPPKNAPKTD